MPRLEYVCLCLCKVLHSLPSDLRRNEIFIVLGTEIVSKRRGKLFQWLCQGRNHDLPRLPSWDRAVPRTHMQLTPLIRVD